MRDGIATPSARNDTLQGNPKLQALNPKQILISKFKTQFSSYQLSVLSLQLYTDCFSIFAFSFLSFALLRLLRCARNDKWERERNDKQGRARHDNYKAS